MINKQLAYLALDEDSPFTNSRFFYIRSTAFVIVVTQKLVLQQSKNVTAKCTGNLSPSPCILYLLVYNCVKYTCGTVPEQQIAGFTLFSNIFCFI